MDAYRAVVSKRDTRAFTGDPVSDDDIRRLLTAARMAGSAKNSQVARMVAVTDAAQRAALVACGDFTSWLGRPPLVVVFTMPEGPGRLFDLGRMAQNLMVVANALGLASCPVTFHHQDRIRDVLDLPDGVVAPNGVGVGHPAPSDLPNPVAGPRLDLDELVHWQRWNGS